jgi:uncharacterized protein (TIGR02145 family)
MSSTTAANTLTDQAGNTYRTVTIGDQVWMADNLTVDRFRNGNLIPEKKTAEEWRKAGENKQPAWCYYENTHPDGAKYSKLYNWFVVSDPRGLCPAGWHVPTDAEWIQLTDFLGGGETAGTKMKSSEGFIDKRNGSRVIGFSGYRSLNGSFYNSGNFVHWWSSTEDNTNNAWCRDLNYHFTNVSRTTLGKRNGLSVRCLKD